MAKISVSAGFVLFFAAFWLFDDTGALSAMIPAVLFHELGHAAALLLIGAGISEIRLDISGFRMDYIYPPGTVGEALSAAAGPGMGIIYALVCSGLGKIFGSEFLLCTAGISLALSLFNLLPAGALDGGRIFYICLSRFVGERRSLKVSFAGDMVISAGMVITGVWLFASGWGMALIPTGMWIASYSLSKYCNNRDYSIE